METGLGRNKGWWGWVDANEERLDLKVLDLLASELDQVWPGNFFHQKTPHSSSSVQVLEPAHDWLQPSASKKEFAFP